MIWFYLNIVDSIERRYFFEISFIKNDNFWCRGYDYIVLLFVKEKYIFEYCVFEDNIV